MTKKEFILEMSMRLWANPKFTPEPTLALALQMADYLEEKGYFGTICRQQGLRGHTSYDPDVIHPNI